MSLIVQMRTSSGTKSGTRWFNLFQRGDAGDKDSHLTAEHTSTPARPRHSRCTRDRSVLADQTHARTHTSLHRVCKD